MGHPDDERSVVTPPGELIARMSATMKSTIAPNTAGPVRSQAYMAAVVLEKLAKQLELAPRHRAQEQQDWESLVRDLLQTVAGTSLPPETRRSLDAVSADCGPESLCDLVRSLYRDRTALGDELFASLLGHVRVALRADIDRRMEYSA